MTVAGLPDTLKELKPNHALLKIIQELKRRQDRNKLALYKPYAKQVEFHNRGAQYRERLFRAGNQGHPVSEMVCTPSGVSTIGELKIGDSVCLPNGLPSKVDGIVELGVCDVWEVKFVSGEVVRCTADHTWSVTNKDLSESEITTAELQPMMVTPPSFTHPFGHMIESVRTTGKAEKSRCISISDAEGLYVCANGVVTHNCGKTWSSAYEIAMHLTGLYPDWWQGKRWSRGVTGWALGQSMESTRDTIQRLVLGRPGEWGTGTIPADLILGQPKRAQGVADCVDCVFVRHVSGGTSRLYFKSCEKGREKLQGETLDFAALDEEPPIDIYIEVLTRTNATRGIVWITFTPLLGMSEVVRMFLQNPTPDRSDTNMTIEDVGHYTEEDKARIVASYPEHEREARAKGIPILGRGRIFPIAESAISVDPFTIPDHWPVICGVDFGIDHPSAGAWIAWDRDTDTTYVYDFYRESNKTPADLVPLIKQRGEWVPVAWPADGLQRSKGDGIQLAEQYRMHGANMLHEYAQLPETGDEGGKQTSRVSVEAGVMGIFEAMKAGKFKVFKGLEPWFEEFRLYHRKDGKIVALQDDLLSATRYGWVMRRYAECPPDPHKQSLDFRRDYDWRAG